MLRYTVSGPFVTCDLGNGNWQLTKGAPTVSEVFLRISDRGAAEVLRDPKIKKLDLEWRDTGVIVLAVTGAQGLSYLEANTAILHEPQGRLYDRLPLASFDAEARGFWNRVFRLMRLPGGRFLLRAFTRRRR